MEEKEKEESEPLDLRSGDQAELILLVISGEEDATQDESALRGKIKIRTFFLNFILFFFYYLLSACVGLLGCRGHGYYKTVS